MPAITLPTDVADRISGVSPPIRYYNERVGRDSQYNEYSVDVGEGGFLLSIEFARSGIGVADEQYYASLALFLSRLNKVGNYFALPISSYNALDNLIPTLPTTLSPTIQSVSNGVYTVNSASPEDGVFFRTPDRLFQIDGVERKSAPGRFRIFPDPLTPLATNTTLGRVTQLRLVRKGVVGFDGERVITKSFSDIEYRSIVELKIIGV